MIIGIDGNEANIKNRVGVNEYAFQILHGLSRLSRHEKSSSDPIVCWVYLKNAPLPDMPQESDYFKYKVLKGGKVWIVTRLMPHLFLTRAKPDIFFTPSHYLPPLAPMPLVCSIMDLGYLKFSAQFRKRDYWQLKLWSAWSMTISKEIISISKSTRDDIVRHYPNLANKIRVTQLGFDSDKYKATAVKRINEVKAKYAIVSDYLLFLGTLKPSKNVLGVIKSWGKIVNKYPNLSLVIAGKKGWLYNEIFEEVRKLRLEGRVIFTDYVDEADKPYLIKGAKGFVLPSFWEGFGIDVLSAFALGVPVVTSREGSLEEVAGDAAIYVDPYNVDSIAGGMDMVLSMSKKEYNRLTMKGREQLKKFSWERTARETLEVLKEAAQK